MFPPWRLNMLGKTEHARAPSNRGAHIRNHEDWNDARVRRGSVVQHVPSLAPAARTLFLLLMPCSPQTPPPFPKRKLASKNGHTGRRSVRSGRLLHAELPAALRVLNAGDVEHFLCINKSRLSAAMLVA